VLNQKAVLIQSSGIEELKNKELQSKNITPNGQTEQFA
jgi:hypothetical protein